MRILATSIALLGCVTIALAEPVRIPGLQSLDGTIHHVVESARPEREYQIFVGLPDAYDADADVTYPALYILDGGELYPLFRSYYGYLRMGGEIPPMILVAISYGTGDWRNGNNRSHDFTAPSEERDFWGGAGAFQSFIRDELLPLVETTYRADSGRRTIFGQSLGGQFVLYTAQTDPGLFWGHIASNPALHRNLEFFIETEPDGESDSRVYVASASNDDPAFRGPALEWMRHWAGKRSTPWALETQTLEGHNHFSAPPAALRRGLVWLFGSE